MSDRILGPLKRLIRELLSPDASDDVPAWAFWVPWEFSVSSATETTFTGRRTSARCPVPDVVNVPNMPGIAGTRIKPAVGSLVTIAFVNGDPSRPRVVGWDQNVADFVGLAGASVIPGHEVGKPVHRVDDQGSGGTFAAAVAPATLLYTGEDGKQWIITLTAGSGMAALPVTAVIAALPGPSASPSPGTIITKATSGSGKVSSG